MAVIGPHVVSLGGPDNEVEVRFLPGAFRQMNAMIDRAAVVPVSKLNNRDRQPAVSSGDWCGEYKQGISE